MSVAHLVNAEGAIYSHVEVDHSTTRTLTFLQLQYQIHINVLVVDTTGMIGFSRSMGERNDP